MSDTIESEVQTINEPYARSYEKSLNIVKEAMKPVKHEILLTLEDDSTHIVFLHDAQIVEGQLVVDFSTMSEDRKEELVPHVQACIQAFFIKTMQEKKARRDRKKLFSL